jgi:membrane protein DedA with SNARE-associated domain
MQEVIDLFLVGLDRHLLPFAFVAAMIDSTGIPFPGRLLLILAGAVAGPVPEVLGLIACAASGAILGDHLLYLLGAWSGDRAVAAYCRLTGRDPGCVAASRARLGRAGVPALIAGRFAFGTVRLAAATLAGTGVIPYRRFLLAEVVGAAAWATAYVLLGRLVGGRAATFVSQYHLPVIVVAVTVAALGWTTWWLLGRQRRRR